MCSQDHERWWGSLTEDAELAVVGLRADGTVQYVSRHLASLIGADQEALIGRPFISEFVAKVHEERAREHFLGKHGEASGASAVIPLRTPDGREAHIRWARTITQAIPDGPVRIASGVDVTQEVLYARDVSAERARLAEAQRVARIGSWELDHRTDALSWSDEVYRIFEIDPARQQPSYDVFLAHIDPRDRDAVDSAYRTSLETRKPYSIRHRIDLGEARQRWVEERSETEFDGAGVPLVSRGTVQDITAAVESAEIARRSETMVSSFLHISPEAMLVTDPTGRILTFSDGAEQVFRCRRRDVVGRSIDQLMPERFRAAHKNHLEGFAQSHRQALRMADRAEIRARRFTGEEFAAEATVSKVPGLHGDLFAVIVRDLSERKAYEAALESAKVRAEAATEAKSAFLATMSHEIRTPMNGVLGMLAVLAMEELKPTHREMVDVAIDAGHALMEILNDILDYSRIEAGELRLELARFDIRSVLKKTQTLHAFKARAAGVDLDVAIDPGVPETLVGDAARIQQILHNLVGNAVKFTRKGRVDVRATCSMHEGEGCTLVVSVADTGIGISKDLLETIFDRFTQADSSITRKFGGSGLGLSIVKGLVSAMGGRIEVTSEPGQGSRFTVSIPVQLSVGEVARIGQASTGVRVGMPHRPVRVLVAEDNVLNADTLRLLLDRKGVVVTLAHNGEEALKLFEPGRFDLVLMDIQMPVLDGESALKVLRKFEAASGRMTAIVAACTAYVDEERAARYRQIGFDHVLPKPIDPDEIDLLIGVAVKRAAAVA